MPKGVYERNATHKTGKYERSHEQKKHLKEFLQNLSRLRKGKKREPFSEEWKKKISNSMKGKIPVNRGIQRTDILKKVDRHKKGLGNECKIHGLHKKWTLHSENNVKCNLCAVERQRLAAKKDPLKFIFRHAKAHSKKSSRPFTITLQDLYQLKDTQKNLCALTDIKFTDEMRPSLDRIDSNKGYEKENIQLVLFEVNRMKSDFSMERFLFLCKKISEAGMSKKKK